MQKLLSFATLLGAIVAVTAGVLAGGRPLASAGGSPAVALIAPPTQPSPGDTFPVAVVGVNLPPLGAYEVVVSFDDQKLEFAYGVDEGFLSSTGRNTSCFPPTLGTGEARFGCATTGSGPGPSGDGTLATLYFNALAPGDVEIGLRDAGLADEFGDNAGDAALRGLMITIQGGDDPRATETPIPTTSPKPEETWEGTPAFVPPVDTPTAGSEPAATNTSVPTATNTRTSTTPAPGATTAGASTPPGGSLSADDPTPSSNVRGTTRAPAGVVLPSTGSAGLHD